MSLEEIFAPFAAALGPENCRFVGPNRVDDSSKPPRISWQPVKAKHLPPARLRGGPGDDGAVLTRQWLIQAEVWGTDLANAEALADRFMATAHELLSQHSYQPGEEDWNPGGVTAHGARCLISFFINRPILRLPGVVRTIRKIQAAMKVQGNSALTIDVEE